MASCGMVPDTAKTFRLLPDQGGISADFKHDYTQEFYRSYPFFISKCLRTGKFRGIWWYLINLTLYMSKFFGGDRIIFTFSVVSWYQDVMLVVEIYPCRRQGCLSYTVSSIVGDVLVSQGARVSTTIALTWFCHDVLASAPQGLIIVA